MFECRSCYIVSLSFKSRLLKKVVKIPKTKKTSVMLTLEAYLASLCSN